MRRARLDRHICAESDSDSSESRPRQKVRIGHVDTAAEEAQENFRKFVVEKYTSGKWSDQDVAQVAYLSGQAYGLGLETFSVDPTARGRNSARKVRSSFDVKANDLVDSGEIVLVDCPLYNPQTCKREWGKVSLRPPARALEASMRLNPARYDSTFMSDQDWDVPAYRSHPTVLEHGTNDTNGVGFYTDKVKYTRCDTYFRASIGAIVGRERQTVWALPSALFCNCGCGGKCTSNTMQAECNRYINALQDGIDLSDPSRTLSFGHAALLEYRADLPERCSVSGHKDHQGRYPCMKCLSVRGDLHERYHMWGYGKCPHGVLSHEVYLDEVNRHLIRVELLDDAAKDRLLAITVMRKKYPWGLGVMTNRRIMAATFGLQGNDKLVAPCGELFYESDFMNMSTPCVVYFWRPSVDSFLSGPSILRDLPDIHQHGVKHFTITRFPDDSLHTAALGYEARLAGLVFWSVIEKLVFGVVDGLTREECDIFNFQELKKLLRPYYTNESLIDPTKELNQIRCFTLGMLGPQDKPELGARGGEVRGLLRFALAVSQRFAEFDPVFPLLASAVSAVLDINAMLRILPRKVPPDKQARICQLYFRFCECYLRSGGSPMPKLHGGAHMYVHDMAYFGNPRFTGTWQDESENGLGATIARSNHGSTFSMSLHQKRIAREKEALALL